VHKSARFFCFWRRDWTIAQKFSFVSEKVTAERYYMSKEQLVRWSPSTLTWRRMLRASVAILSVALVGIGLAALLAPGFAAAGYGVDVSTLSDHAYVRGAGVRDIAIGGILLVLLARLSETRTVGIAVLVATLVPIVDTINVLQASGVRPALILHVGSILPMMILAIALLGARANN